jgi:AraC family transcriptional regulator of adaptative response/methylated-DNA-[protein]-cysteine methyltransferase
VCFVELGDDDQALEAGLAAEYPLATREEAPTELRDWMGAVLATLDGSSARGTRGTAAVPLDVKATDFKWRVWRALQEIPYGETRSYAEVAAAIGAPKAVRAVANACATNNAALVIPCHRVIGSNGTLTGYRWGVDRKRRLLEHERDQAARRENGGSRGTGARGIRNSDGSAGSAGSGSMKSGSVSSGKIGGARERAAARQS